MEEQPESPNEGLVPILVVSMDDDGTRDRERMWAHPIEGRDEGGLFEIRNIGLFAPLAPGDVVRCALDGDSRYQVVDVVHPQPVGVGTARTTTPEQAIQLVEMVESVGASAVVQIPGLVSVVSEDPRVFVALERMLDEGHLEAWLSVRNPQIPVHQWGLVLEIESQAPDPTAGTNTSYWAADDPYWAEHQLADISYLARIQMLVSSDARIADAVTSGRQDDVVEYLRRIDAIDRGEPVDPATDPVFTDE